MNKISEIEKAIDNVFSAIHNQLWIREWEFQIVNEEYDKAHYDEKCWKKVKDPSWSTGEGTAFLRHKLIVPSEIEGIPVSGSDIKITFVFPSGMIFFLDGKQIYEQKFWADMRVEPMTIIDNAACGETHTLMVVVPKGDGHGGIFAELNLEPVENILFELFSIRYQLLYAMEIAKKVRNKKFKKIIDSALSVIEVSDINERRWDKVLEQIKAAENLLEPFRQYAKKINVHLIGHAHIDMNWLWNYEETKNVCIRDFNSVISLMKEFPDLTFSQSQSHVYKIVEENKPEIFKEVCEKIKENRWEVNTNAWVENDLNLVCGESIVRHILYARKYAKEKLGNVSSVMWCPDTFGHPATMPSICSNAGMKYYFHMRCGSHFPLYRWKGPDGSEVIVYKAVYNNKISPETIAPALIKFINMFPDISEMMFPYGVGDHGGGPTKRDHKMKEKMDKKPVFPNLIFSTAEKFFTSIEKFRNKLPVIKGELNTIFEGCYTTHSDIKDINRKCEDILLALESIMAIAVWRKKIESEDIKKLENLWQKTLFNQFHDILCGSAIKEAYRYSVELGNSVITEAKKLMEKYVKTLSGDGQENNLVIFNPLCRERNCLINIPSSDEHFLFEKIPACGLLIKNAGEIKKNSSRTIEKKSEEIYETEFYTITIDRKTGVIKNLYDKKNKRDVVSIASPAIAEDPCSWWAETSSNLISVHYEQPHRMSAWIIGNILSTEYLYETDSINVKDEPFRMIISVIRKYKSSLITQKIILYSDFPYIDFETLIDWKEQGNSINGVPMVRTNFSFSMKNPSAYYEIPFGCIERNITGKEYPAIRWAGMKEKNYWAGIILKNRHGFNASGRTLSCTLLRNAYEPDAQSDTGHHEIYYRLFFGKLNPVEITKMAEEFTLMPVVFETNAGLKNMTQLFEIKGNVIVSSVKPSLDGKAIVIRVVEMLGKKQKFTIIFDRKPESVFRINLNEQEISKILSKKSISMEINPYEIVSLKIK